MHRKEVIQISIDYIEKNLQADFSVSELAEMSGYSFYHFCRLFRAFVGIPVKEYIHCRKLLYCAYEISCGAAPSDVAFKYGFGSYSGFYKAFMRQFGSLPSEYVGRNIKMPQRINILKEENMFVSIKRAKEFLSRYDGVDHLQISEIFYPSSGNKAENTFYVGDEYVLKFAPAPDGIITDIVLSSALCDGGIVSSKVIGSKDGEDYISDGEIYCYLKTRINGNCVMARNLYDENYFPDAEYIGSLIGKLHKVLAEIDYPADEVNLPEKIKKYMPEAKAILGLTDNFCSLFEEKLSAFYEFLPVQLIHRDPNPGNITGGGNEYGFIDFVLSEKNVRIYDICYAATAVLSETYDKNNPDMIHDWVKIYKSIVRGYDKTAVLSECEKEALPYIILANQIICTVYFSRYEKFAGIFNINKDMTLKIIDIFNELKI